MDAGNIYHCIGRIGKDPELKMTPSGMALCKFSLAVDHGFGEKKTTMWFNVTAFGKTAERCEKVLAKGKQIAVVGSLNLREYTDQAGAKKQSNDLDLDDFKMIGPKDDAPAKPAAVAAGDQYEDDLPF